MKKTESVSPDEALKHLKSGNARLVRNELRQKDFNRERLDLIQGQSPYAIVLGCSDSRVPPELIFDESLGKLFIVRTAGDVVDPVVLGSIEYAVLTLHVTLLLVLGHESCGAVRAALRHQELSPNLKAVINRITPALHLRKGETAESAISTSIYDNVRLQMKRVYQQSEVLRELVDKGKFRIAGGVYHLSNGVVEFLE